MYKTERRTLVLIFTICLILFIFLPIFKPIPCLSTDVLTTDKWSSDFRPHGGYIDEVLFVTFPDYGYTAKALVNGDIDAWDDHEEVSAFYLPALMKTPKIEIKFGLSESYRLITFNCERFPTNITAYRRAMAFALDKNLINIESTGGLGEPLDSYIPLIATQWEVESELDSHFYKADYSAGNATLETAGFIDLDNDGWREYDKNHNGKWDLGYDLDDNETAIEMIGATFVPAVDITLNFAQDALEKMGLKATIITMSISEFIPEMAQGNHWAVCLSFGVSFINTPSYLYDLFRTGTEDNTLFSHFSNVTIDAILDKMANSKSLLEVKNYTLQVNKLLAHEQPMLVCYNEAYINAYRTDKFEGYILFNGKGVIGDNHYTYTKLRLNESMGGPNGGTFRIGWTGNIRPLNVLNEWYGPSFHYLELIYETLWQIDPITWDPIPGVAYDWIIEETTVDVTTGIQNGQKFTFYLYDNATWHDGQPVTSEDVKYSFETLRPHCHPASPYTNEETKNIYRIDTPDQHTVEIYVNKSGYWIWGLTTDFFVLPKHIWEPHSPDFSAWIPSTPVDLSGSGPYKFNEYIRNEHLSLIRYDNWRWDIRDLDKSSSDSSSGFEVFIAFSVLAITSVHFKQRKLN